MIIRYPTGSYKTILPQKPSDNGNITFTISNNVPPKTNLLFPKIPPGLLNYESVVSNDRDFLGALIFSVSKSNKTLEGNNSKQYEVGQLLEFNTSSTQAVEPMLVNSLTEVRHNINTLNYNAMGLDSSEQAIIENLSTVSYNNITQLLNEARQNRADSEQLINDYQKTINELSRTIKALEVIVISSSNSDIIVLLNKLNKQFVMIKEKLDQEIINANNYSNQATILLGRLIDVGVVVK